MAGRGYKFPNGDKHTFNLWLRKSHYAELQELASHEGRSVADIIRQLIAEFLRDDSDQPPKRGNRRETR